MNKNAIQKFAIWARNELISQVSQRAYQYGIEESGFGDASADAIGGRLLTAEEKSQRQELIRQIREKGYKQVMEEVAYTWFNRFAALRFMEVNNYLPSHIRVFSDSTGAFRPEILGDALHLDLPGLDGGKVAEYIESNDTEGLYRYLLLTQCNALNESLPVMFERMGGYTEMLLPNNILRQDSVLGRMVEDIPEEDWRDAVQIIGWLYQYYNTELKDDTFANLKKNVKISKERIPAATQLFTPDWIVRYMVENSVGRLWLDGHPDDELRGGWKYYLDEAEQKPEVDAQLEKLREEYRNIKPEEIKVIDPCMGSGHILVYAFDVLMKIYTSAGWDQRDAAQSILRNNLYGLDIDERAAQLAYFAVMMKARQYDRRLLTRGIQPNLFAIRESNRIDEAVVRYFHKGDPELKAAIESVIDDMRDAKEYGSIISVRSVDFERLYARFDEIIDEVDLADRRFALDDLLPVVKSAELLSTRYDVAVTNPPYMGGSGMNPKLSEYVKGRYPDSKSDLFACFIERGFDIVKSDGYISMITMESWMFLSSFEKMRQNILNSHTIVNMVHMPYLGKGGTSLGINFGTAAVIFNNRYCRDYNSQFDYICYYETDDEGVPFAFPTINERYKATQAANFSKIPGCPVAYWIGNDTFELFENEKHFSEYVDTKSGLSTTDNNRFLRFWYEVDYYSIGYTYKDLKETADCLHVFIPHQKGGEYRKWYGNLEYVVNWYNNGAEIRRAAEGASGGRIVGSEYYLREGLTWTDLTSTGKISVRFAKSGSIFNSSGPMCFCHDRKMEAQALGYMNSCVANAFLELLAPTFHFNGGPIGKLPYIPVGSCLDIVNKSVQENVELSMNDWDSYEISWDFNRSPLI